MRAACIEKDRVSQCQGPLGQLTSRFRAVSVRAASCWSHTVSLAQEDLSTGVKGVPVHEAGNAKTRANFLKRDRIGQ